MTIKYRNTNTGWTDLNPIILKDPVRFPHHLHFFFGESIVLEIIDVWDCVKRNLFAIHPTFNLLRIQ